MNDQDAQKVVDAFLRTEKRSAEAIAELEAKLKDANEFIEAQSKEIDRLWLQRQQFQRRIDNESDELQALERIISNQKLEIAAKTKTIERLEADRDDWGDARKMLRSIDKAMAALERRSSSDVDFDYVVSNPPFGQ